MVNRRLRFRSTPALLVLSAITGLALAGFMTAIAAGQGGAAGEPPSSLLGVFDRARDSSDSVPAGLQAVWAGILEQAPDAVSPGSANFEQSRAASLGNTRIWLIPTDTGKLCRLLETPDAGGCIDSTHLQSDGIDWGLVDPDGFGTGEPTSVWGVASRSVTDIVADTANGQVHAAIEGSAFVLRTDSYPRSLTVLKDGMTVRIPVPAPPH